MTYRYLLAWMKKYCWLFICLAYLCLLKGTDLPLPFFWDASWVYAPAIFEMNQVGPSLLPWAIPIELSRGHPLLFHFIAASWSAFFGTSPFSLHLFTLVISLGILIILYRITQFIFSDKEALLAVAILVSQEIFLAQSTQLLPEALLTLLILLSFWFYLKKQWILFVISATALLYTKESGFVFLMTLLFYTIIDWLSVRRPLRLSWDRIKIVVLLLVPFLLGAIHFLLLHKKFGWYFYPLHLDYFKTSWQSFHQDLSYIWDVIWKFDGRIYLSLLAVIAILISLEKKKLIAVFGLILITYFGYITFYRHWPSPSYFWKIMCLVSLVLIYFLLLSKIYKGEPQTKKVLSIGLLYLAFFTFFSAYNVFTVRYLHNLLPWYAIFVAWGIGRIVTKKWISIGIAMLIMGVYTFYFHQLPNDGISDSDLNYRHGIQVQKQLIEYCHKLELQSSPIHASLLEKVAMQHPQLGYLNNYAPFELVDLKLDTTVHYALFTNVAFEPTYHQMDSLGFIKIHRIEAGDAWAEVYKNGRIKE